MRLTVRSVSHRHDGSIIGVPLAHLFETLSPIRPAHRLGFAELAASAVAGTGTGTLSFDCPSSTTLGECKEVISKAFGIHADELSLHRDGIVGMTSTRWRETILCSGTRLQFPPTDARCA